MQEELEHDKPRDPTVNAAEEVWKVLAVSVDREVEGEDTMGVVHLPSFPMFLPVVSSNMQRTSQYPILMPIIVKPRRLSGTALALSMFGGHPRFAKCVAHYGIQCKTNIDEQK